jgi:hypothetical protein
VNPYYQQDGITIYHGDCRDVLSHCGAVALVTDPPYPNNAGHFVEAIPAAREVISGRRWEEALVFWSELEFPPCPMPLVAVHIWHRNNVNGRPYEPVFHFSRDGEKRRSRVISMPAVFNGAGPGCREFLGHPTQKPLDLMRHLLLALRTKLPVLDPFMGVGATLVAAKDLRLEAVGVEREERYCEIAARRLSQGLLDLGGVA